MNFCSGGEKMTNACGHQNENERRKKKSEQEHVRHFLHKSFWKFHDVVVQNNSKEMYKKSVLHMQSCFLCRPIVVFSPLSLPSPLSITLFYILFEQT